MRFTSMRIIVDNPHSSRNGCIGVIQQSVLSSERGLFVSVRFGDRIEVLSSKDFKIHPDDVVRMDRELEKEREFFLGDK